MDLLGRFYTNNFISELLITEIENQTPKKVLDLGVGDASLSIEAYKKWNDASFFATEIETHKVHHINENLLFLKVYNYDTLNPNLSAKLKIKLGAIDVAICNPPYTKVGEKEKYFKLFIDIKCNGFLKLKRITSEIVFFAHNINLLKRNGELGIIVSDSLITGKEFIFFRETILQEFEVKKIIQLPDKIFNKTEARTHIIFLSKKKPVGQFTELYFSNMIGVLSEKICVNKTSLIERMDYQFHSLIDKQYDNLLKLKDINATIKRGRFSYKYLKGTQLSYIHTNGLTKKSQELTFNQMNKSDFKELVAGEGDILMGRVGKLALEGLRLLKMAR